ncbi:MAG: S-methyl-5'-thioadenosine phosphorylase [Alphaproteobacteria bacterium]|nr:S-methyl-5'-thioadenosine phosphorylase [Alphaproteobacteria bacterium]
MALSVLGIIGGSGIYDLPMDNARWEKITSPWGEPSDAVRRGEIDGLPVVFMPRHGRGHVQSPSSINYRANIDVLKRAGVTDLYSLSAVGSLHGDLPPGTFVLVDQFIDRTYSREKSFFGTGCVGHVAFSHPISPALQDIAEVALRAEGIAHARGGTCVVMEGPQFSTLAEAQLYRSWGARVIGMTAMPEAKLAREAEISYCTIAMVTDYDCWHEDHGSVDVAKVVTVLKANSGMATNLMARIARDFPREHPSCPAGSDSALDFAIMTVPDMRDPQLLAKLDAVAGRVLKG